MASWLQATELKMRLQPPTFVSQTTCSTGLAPRQGAMAAGTQPSLIVARLCFTQSIFQVPRCPRFYALFDFPGWTQAT
jgi:hypothetical protein